MQEQNVYFSTNKYNNLSDEDVIKLIKQGDNQALSYLLERYKELVNITSSFKYLVAGGGLEPPTFGL